MKKIFSVVIALCLLSAVFCLSVGAVSPKVVDDAGLLDLTEEKRLENLLEEVSLAHSVEILVVTVDSTMGKTPMEYADDFFDAAAPGADGLLLLVSMEESDWWISTAGKCIEAFTDAGMDYMAEQFVPYMSDGDFGEAFMCFANLCDDFLIRAEEGEPYDRGSLPKEEFKFGIAIVIALAVGAAAAFLITAVMKSKLNNVSYRASADSYIAEGGLTLSNATDMFLYSNVNRTPRAESKGGSSTHTSSSGTIHGGRGGKF